jgi:hypothetical protein
MLSSMHRITLAHLLACATAAVTATAAGAAPHRDVDGDGFDDATLDHRALWFGGKAGLTAAATTPHAPRAGGFLFDVVEIVGDVNGDGKADIVVGDPGCPDYARDMPECGVGSIHLFLGGSRTFGKPAQSLSIPDKNSMFGGQVVALGDVNGDGRDDIAVPAHDGVHVFFGAAGGLSPTAVILPGSNPVALGDVDGDGRADLLVYTAQGWVLYYGADPKRTDTVPLPAGASFYGSAGHGDFNGDGFDDVAVAIEPASPDGRLLPNEVYVYPGSRNGLVRTPSVHFTRDHARAEFGMIASVGDLDGDKRDDLVVVASCSKFDAKASSCEAGTAYVYLGGANGLAVTPVAALSPTRSNMSISGNALVPLGDVDHDGRADFAFGAYVFRGGSGGVADLHPKSL